MLLELVCVLFCCVVFGVVLFGCGARFGVIYLAQVPGDRNRHGSVRDAEVQTDPSSTETGTVIQQEPLREASELRRRNQSSMTEVGQSQSNAQSSSQAMLPSENQLPAELVPPVPSVPFRLMVRADSVDIPIFYWDCFYHSHRGCAMLVTSLDIGASAHRLTFCHLCGNEWEGYSGVLYYSPISGKKYHIRETAKDWKTPHVSLPLSTATTALVVGDE